MKPSKRRDLLIEHADKARISRKLVTLREDAPLPVPVEALGVREPEKPKLGAFLAAQGFRSIASRLGLDDQPDTRRPGRNRRRPGADPRTSGGRPARLRPLRDHLRTRRPARLGRRGPHRRYPCGWTPKPTAWMRCEPG